MQRQKLAEGAQTLTEMINEIMISSGVYRYFKARPHCVSTVLVSSNDLAFEEWFQNNLKSTSYRVVYYQKFIFRLTLSKAKSIPKSRAKSPISEKALVEKGMFSSGTRGRVD